MLLAVSSLVAPLWVAMAVGMVWSGGGMLPWLAVLLLALLCGGVLFTILECTVTLGSPGATASRAP